MTAQKERKYDADAHQIIPFTFHFNQKQFLLELTVAPLEDRDFITFSQKVKQHEKTVGVDGEEIASVWVWNLLAERLDGMAGDQPADWKDKIAAADKASFIDNLYLVSGLELAEVSAVDEPLSWSYATEKQAGIPYNLTVFFEGKPLITRHEIQPISKEKTKECWTELRKAQPDYNELGAILDFHLVKSEGYAGRVPLYHKLALLIGHLQYDRVSVAKN